MYETLVRPIEVFQIPPPQPITVVSEKLKRSELKREDKRLRQIAANRAAAATAKRKRDAVADGDDGDEKLNATELADGASQISNKRPKMEEDEGFPITEEDDGVPQIEEQDMNIDGMTLIGGPSTSALPVAADITTTNLSMSISRGVADILTSTSTTSPAKINVSKVLPEVRGHTSYLTFASLIPIPGSVQASAVPLEVPANKTSSE